MNLARFLLTTACALLLSGAAGADSFRVLPYLQNPAPDAITVRWLSESGESGVVVVQTDSGPREFHSEPAQAETLQYNPFGEEPGGPHSPPPYLHTVRVEGLRSDTSYDYVVRQSGDDFAGRFRTAPGADRAIRFIIYADSETEPESSTSPPVDWPAGPRSNRREGIKKYVADQTTGYRENLRVIAARRPDFLMIAGDLVESGGEQRDWDEFWRHVAGDYGTLASQVPILPALGNHENFGGPGAFGGYSARAANFATDKYRTYFDVPPNGAGDPKHRGRYYRIDYGPITLITLDSSDGLPHGTASDTNHNLSGSNAPDFNPGSEQYAWLERQLADAQRRSRFTFVQFHHTAFGSGPHSVPFGTEGFSGQSGIAMRVLVPLMSRYGVDAVFSGHDEMLERSLVPGTEALPDGTSRPHEIHFYDTGISGDGLRGPAANFDNPYRKFLAHDDALEVWDGKRLESGGKHYGHVEVNVRPDENGRWTAEIVPVHLFPRMNDDGRVTGWERRLYDDRVVVEQQ
jgi:hypothetical protein